MCFISCYYLKYYNLLQIHTDIWKWRADLMQELMETDSFIAHTKDL